MRMVQSCDIWSGEKIFPNLSIFIFDQNYYILIVFIILYFANFIVFW